MEIMRYPSNASNVQGNTIPYKACEDLNNIKSNNDSVAHWGRANPGRRFINAIAGKNGSRPNPSYLTLSNFQINIPDNAKVTSISVQYAYRKMNYSANKSERAHASFGGPVITLKPLGVKKIGNAPPRNNFGYYSTRFDVNLRGKDVNKANFTVLFDIPGNTNTEPAYIEMKYLRVIVIYTAKNYVPSLNISPSELMYGENATISCNIQETTGMVASERVSTNLIIPSSLKATGLSSTSPSIMTQNGKGKLTFSVTPSSASVEGPFNIKFTENATSHSAQKTLIVKKPNVKVTGFELINKEVEVSTDTKKNTTILDFSISTPAPTTCILLFDFSGLQYEGMTLSANNTITINPADWVQSGDEYIYSKSITVYGTEIKDYVISMTSGAFIDTYSQTLSVVIPALSQPYYTILNLNDFTLENLKDGEKYVFSCIGRVMNADTIVNGVKNNRAAVVNGKVEVLTNKISGTGLWEELKCEFTYDKNNPIWIIFYGNYIEYNLGHVEYGNLCLIHADRYNGYEYPIFTFNPLKNLILDGDYANALLEPPELAITTKHFFTEWNWQGIEESDVLIHGIEISGDISTTSPVNVICGLGSVNDDELNYTLDSAFISEDKTSFKLGGKFKTFGLKFTELNKLLPDLRFFMQVDDAFDNITPFNVDVKNINLSIYYTLNNGEDCDFYINGIPCRYYLIRMNPETEINHGANFDAQTYKVEGADGEYPTRINITENTINLKFYIMGDDFEDSTELLEYVTEFLYPERDHLDNPVLKAISFFFDKEHCYDYYIADAIESTAIPGGYECSVDLVVPAGLKRTVEKVRKSFAGTITAIGKIKPEIYFYKMITENDVDEIQLIESFSGRILTLTGEFIQNIPEFTNFKVDCENRRVYYKNDDDWFLVDSNNIGIDSEFFILDNEYNFESSVNCKVTSVLYHEYGG